MLNTKEFIAASKIVSVVAVSNAPIPILATAKLENGKLFGTDLDQTISVDLGVQVEPVVIPNIKKLADILKLAGGEQVEFKQLDMLEIKSGQLTHKEDLIKIDAWPLPSKIPKVCSGEISSEDVDKFLIVARAMSTESVRYYLNGIYFDGSTIVATDGHRMYFTDLVYDDEMGAVIIPRLTVTTLKKTRDKNSPVLFKAYGQGEHPKYISFEYTSAGFPVTLHSKVVDGTFPNYKRVIPDDRPLKVAIPEELPQHAKILAKIATIGRPSIRVSLEDRTISYQKTSLSFRMADSFFEIPDFDVNAHYLNDILSFIGARTMEMTTDSRGSIVFSGGSITALLMPMR